MKKIGYLIMLGTLSIQCENRDINEGEEFKLREINEDYQRFHFNKITYDGADYLITERDNNNPHEGFGFMALNGRPIIKKQDSILTRLRAIEEIQKRIYAKLYNLSENEVDIEFEILLNQYSKSGNKDTSPQGQQLEIK